MRACRQTDGSFKESESCMSMCFIHSAERESNKSLSKSLAETISFQHGVLPLTAQTTGAVSTT